MNDTIEVRNKLKNIPLKEDFNALLNNSTLTPTQREIMKLHYLEDKDFRYISDVVGYSEDWVKKLHIKALKKLSRLI